MGLEDKISIWQQNVNKSPTSQHDLLSNNELIRKGINVVALQEPAINAYNNTVASRDWTTVYPTTHATAPDKTRAVTLLSSQFSSDNWNQLDFPSGDVTVIQMTGEWGKLIMYSIYNDGGHNETVRMLTRDHQESRVSLNPEDQARTHTIWLGDFNRHHPHWDDPSDVRLFTREAISAAEVLIEAVADAGLELALPSGVPTHVHNVTKQWSRLDQVFISEHLLDLIITCDTQSEHRGLNTDHLPILTELNLSAEIRPIEPIPNFREVDWDDFGKALEKSLKELPPEGRIKMQSQLDQSCGDSVLRSSLLDCKFNWNWTGLD